MDTARFDFVYAASLVPELARGFGVTVQATILGTVLALVAGLLFALARAAPSRLVARTATFLVELIRNTPLLVQLYVLFFALPSLGVSLSPLTTGVLGLGLHYASYMSEVYRAGIEAVPRGQWDAARALRLSRAHTFRAVILPQAVPPMVPALGNYAVAMLKDTPLLSAITVNEIVAAAQLEGARSFRYLEAFSLVGCFFLGATLVATFITSRLERRLSHVRA